MQDDAPFVTRQTDGLDPARACALQATLGDAPTLTSGDVMPDFFHQAYFWNPLPPSALGDDGHPATGDALIPDFGLPQRMWAGGALTFHRPLILGQLAEKVSQCVDVVQKQGRSGRLAFVTLRHDYHQSDALCLTENQTIVYREETSMSARKPPMSDRQAQWSEERTADTTLLFRYSALTFNGHRIHYDLDFATGPGGYAGLVVHGPLLAQWMIARATQVHGTLARFDFRAVSPLMHSETARLCEDADGFWVEADNGRVCMTATALGQ